METAKGELVPGGLAMVYGLVNHPINNGLVVTTERKAVDGESDPDGRTYNSTEDGWFCTGRSIVNKHGGKGHAYFSPSNLIPIKPEADPLHTEQEKCTND